MPGEPEQDPREKEPRETEGGSEAPVLVVFLLALLTRVVVALAPPSGLPGSGAAFDQYALRLAAGLGFGPSSLLPPLYPYFLAMLYRVYGYGQIPVSLAQALLGALTAALVYLLARAVRLTPGWAVAAALGGILYPPSVAETRHLAPVGLAAGLLALAVFLWLRRSDGPSAEETVLAGLVLGLCALTRSGLALPALFLLAARPVDGGGRTRDLVDLKRALAVLAVLATISPWIVRNSTLHHRPAWIESTWALRLRSVTIPEAPKVRLSVPGTLAHSPDNLVLTDNALALAEVMGYAALEPRVLLRTWLRRGFRLLLPIERSHGGYFDRLPRWARGVRLLEFLIWGLLMNGLLAWLIIAGGRGVRERAIALCVLGIAVLAVLSGSLTDGRILALPLVSVLAGRGAAEAVPVFSRSGRRWRRRRLHRLLFFLAASLLLWGAALRVL